MKQIFPLIASLVLAFASKAQVYRATGEFQSVRCQSSGFNPALYTITDPVPPFFTLTCVQDQNAPVFQFKPPTPAPGVGIVGRPEQMLFASGWNTAEGVRIWVEFPVKDTLANMIRETSTGAATSFSYFEYFNQGATPYAPTIRAVIQRWVRVE